MTSTTQHPAVAAYQARLRAAAQRLPRRERRELIEAVDEHLRAGLETAVGDAEVLNMLDALGDPEGIVAAAAPAEATRRLGFHEIAAVFLLLFGAFVVPLIGWIGGVVLLWTSPAWTRLERWLGALVFPGGLAAPLLLYIAPPTRLVCSYREEYDEVGPYTVGGCTAEPIFGRLSLVVLVVVAVLPVAVAVHLLRSARTRPDQSSGTI